ncbi:MAG TPA: Wadjet anti-phage system protein JetD domain-containing protein [Ktedonobacteraceae bacterium]|nr:Wadjet anti-phage system protein JetD domain-containing protein [Ktedonobacteraceae bacterium]
MITPADIRQKAARLYIPFLRAWLDDRQFFPQEIPAGKLPSDYVELRKGVRALQAQSKEARGSGYTLEYQVQQKRFSGQQTVPVRASIETQQDFLWLIEKEEEFDLFRQDVTLIRERLPQLVVWIEQSPQKVIEHHGLWPDLLAVCRYFLDHPTSNLYIRELPINVHTKFIEQRRGIVRELLEQLLPQEAVPLAATTFEQRFGLREKDPFVRMRLLDEQLYTRYHLPLTELSVPVSQLEALDLLRGQRCIVTENEMTFLTLPPYKDTFALFGGGFMVRNLEGISWLAQCPILYWGDLDAQGFQILSGLRAFFPHVISVMMDRETLSTFSEFCVVGTPCLIQQLPHLTDEEHTLFLHLAENNLRLEQERISHAYAVRQLYSLITDIRYQV